MMTKFQGEALIGLLGQLRKDWDLPGIRAAITTAATLGSPAEVAVAACRVAGNRGAKTPGLIPQPGSHWQGTAVGAQALPIRCLTHSDQPLGRCTVCDTEARTMVDHGAGVTAVRDALKAARS